MNASTAIGSTRAVASFLDKALTVTSMVAIPVLVATSFVWMVSPAPTESLWYSHETSAAYSSGSVVSVGIPMELTKPLRRGTYWITLTQGGQTIYRFPSHDVRDSERFDFQTLAIQVPASLPRGQYSVELHISYGYNPFKNGHTTVRLSGLTIK